MGNLSLTDAWWALAFVAGLAVGFVAMVQLSNWVWRKACDRDTQRAHDYAHK